MLQTVFALAPLTKQTFFNLHLCPHCIQGGSLLTKSPTGFLFTSLALLANSPSFFKNPTNREMLSNTAGFFWFVSFSPCQIPESWQSSDSRETFSLPKAIKKPQPYLKTTQTNQQQDL